jgi:hypothetical protein
MNFHELSQRADAIRDNANLLNFIEWKVKRKKYFLQEKNTKQGIVEIEEDEEEDKKNNRPRSQCFINIKTSRKIFTSESCNMKRRFKYKKYLVSCQID